MAEKVIVYSVIFSNFDKACDVRQFLDEGIRFVLFTDDLEIEAPGWEVVICEGIEDPILANRKLKITPPKFVTKYPFSLYVDGNVSFESGFLPFVKKMSNVEADLAANPHPRFESVFLDIREIVRKGVISAADGLRDLVSLNRLGVTKKFPFYECNIIWRSSKPITLSFNQLWWAHYVNGSGRDQSAFVKALFQSKKTILPLNLGDIRSSIGKEFTVLRHKRDKPRLRRFVKVLWGGVRGDLFAFESYIWKILSKKL